MNIMRVALITGITGQDGSYLTESLLEKEYVVYGIIRRSSSINTGRIDHLFHHKNLLLRYGDLTDSSGILGILHEIKNKNPSMDRLEIYNLGAMSHVKVSFEVPEYTADTDALGTLRLLNAIRSCGLQDITRFYQASTSEMYGKVQEVPQKETTPFYPRSPYGVAKLYGHWITKNYRESYDMFACSGILFNHETLAGFMPVIIKKNNQIDIKPISEVVRYDTLKSGVFIDESNPTYQEGKVENELFIWDNSDWTRVTFASGYPHEVKVNNKKPKFILSKNTAYLVTGSHEIIMEDDTEKEAQKIEVGDKVKCVELPKEVHEENISNELCEFMGYKLANEVDGKLCMKKYDFDNQEISQKYSFYNEDGTKRIPKEILNGTKEQIHHFYRGMKYVRETISRSPTLIQGVIYLNQKIGIDYFELNYDGSDYKVEFTERPNCDHNKVKKIIHYNNYEGWFYDLETESGKFHAGVGYGRIHNSPRRGPTFVTRKITIALGKILKGEQEDLVLGNLDAKRDWGHAKDYVEGMYLMLQQEKADDYVLSTNRFYSVREFVEKAFGLKGFQIRWEGSGVNEVGIDEKTGKTLIRVSERYFRPAEVEELLGDSSKAREHLKWEPSYSFDQLVKEMVEEDCK